MSHDFCTVCAQRKIGLLCRCTQDIILPPREEFTLLISTERWSYYPHDEFVKEGSKPAYEILKEYWNKASFFLVTNGELFGIKNKEVAAYASVEGKWQYCGLGEPIPIKYPTAMRYIIVVGIAPSGNDLYKIARFRRYMFKGLRPNERIEDRCIVASTSQPNH